jgi:hypothetical protein
MTQPIEYLVKTAQAGLERIAAQSFLSWQGGAALNGMEAIKRLQERVSELEAESTPHTDKDAK